jgi:hypothetical protein
MSGWPADTQDVTGQEATVSAFSPTHRGTAWSVSVWLPSVEEVWSFDEDDLESLGLVELEGDDDPKVRVPLDHATHVASFGGDLGIRLVTEIPESEAVRVVADAESAVRSVIDVQEVTWKGEVHWHPPYRYDIDLDVRTRGDSRDAFETLVASRESGWISRVDDGWSASFWWSAAADDDNSSPFLVAEASDLCVWLTPWSSPAMRPVKRERTNDPGLPGFTPSPPVMGYEGD